MGCNEAFTLGPAICPVLLFSDIMWFRTRRDALEEYYRAGGVVYTQCQKMKQCDGGLDWVITLKRFPGGLHTTGVGFGGNSGCSATNLALLLGASTVYLLGIDCEGAASGATHWHPHYGEKRTGPGAFNLFEAGWAKVKQALPEVFPGRSIINLNPDSGLDKFAKCSWETHGMEVAV